MNIAEVTIWYGTSEGKGAWSILVEMPELLNFGFDTKWYQQACERAIERFAESFQQAIFYKIELEPKTRNFLSIKGV